jgi:hypothetical protein
MASWIVRQDPGKKTQMKEAKWKIMVETNMHYQIQGKGMGRWKKVGGRLLFWHQSAEVPRAKPCKELLLSV